MSKNCTRYTSHATHMCVSSTTEDMYPYISLYTIPFFADAATTLNQTCPGWVRIFLQQAAHSQIMPPYIYDNPKLRVHARPERKLCNMVLLSYEELKKHPDQSRLQAFTCSCCKESPRLVNSSRGEPSYKHRLAESSRLKKHTSSNPSISK